MLSSSPTALASGVRGAAATDIATTGVSLAKQQTATAIKYTQQSATMAKDAVTGSIENGKALLNDKVEGRSDP